jgi:hypothetical protein
MKMKLRRTDLYITQKQYEEIMKEAEERGITFSEMFRKVIDWYLEKNDNK